MFVFIQYVYTVKYRLQNRTKHLECVSCQWIISLVNKNILPVTLKYISEPQQNVKAKNQKVLSISSSGNC